jgi:hypothetical protein
MRVGSVWRVGAIFAVLLLVAGCYRSPLNPPRLVTNSASDMSIQLFMQATILLSNYYGYSTIRYADIQERAAQSGLQLLPFMPPETVRATPQLVGFFNTYQNNPAELERALRTYGGYKALVKYYIRTGLRASQSLCRGYLLDLEERSAYLEFLQKEIGVVAALSTSILALVNANATLSQAFLIGRAGLDAGIDVYQEFRFLNVDREAARAVIEAAQNALAEHYLRQVDSASVQSNSVTGGYTFSDALHAVSMIEYQCTRSGIRSLLTRSINNTPTNIMVDPVTGTFVFRSTRQGGVTMSPAGPPRIDAPPPIVVPGSGAAVAPVVVRERPVVVAAPTGPGPDRPPNQPPPPAAQNFAAIVSGFDSRLHPPERVFSVLAKLCVRSNESPTAPRTNSLIKVYQLHVDPMRTNPGSVTGKLTDAQITSLQEINTNCPTDRANFYEWQEVFFRDGLNSPAVISLLNRRLQGADKFRPNQVVRVEDVREKLPVVRRNVPGLVLNDAALAKQFTPDLVQQIPLHPQLP